MGFVGGAMLGDALAGRNSAGTYTLPPGNPVIPGTVISSSNENAFRNDVATELTNSLSRTGQGGMTAPLQLASGTAGTPAVTFVTDPDTGLYSAAANNPAMSAGGIKAQDWTVNGVGIPSGTVALPSLSFFGDPDTGLYSAGANNPAVSAGGAQVVNWTSTNTTLSQQVTVNTVGTGGTGAALQLKPGTADRTFMEFYARTATPAVRSGLVGFAVVGGNDLLVANNATNGSVTLAPNGTGIVSLNAPVLVSTANPASTTGFTNTITPANISKAWFRAHAGAQTGGFNIGSATCAANNWTLNLAAGLSSATNAAVVATSHVLGVFLTPQVLSTTQIQIQGRDTAANPVNLCGGSGTLSVVLYGVQ